MTRSHASHMVLSMRPPRSHSVVAGIVMLLLLASGAHAEGEAVARPVYVSGGQTRAAGTVFFIAVDDEVGVAAVGAAHSFDLPALRGADEVRFQLGTTKRQVSVSSRFLVPPGRPFDAPGSSLREDFVVFALDVRPSGIRVLEPDSEPQPPGRRVQLLGVPATIPQDEDDLFGTVADQTDTRIDVDLDVPADLRGWGGAPVLSYPEGRVIGLLEAAVPRKGTLRVSLAPIEAVLEALDSPLDGGRGLPFALAPEAGLEGKRKDVPQLARTREETRAEPSPQLEPLAMDVPTPETTTASPESSSAAVPPHEGSTPLDPQAEKEAPSPAPESSDLADIAAAAGTQVEFDLERPSPSPTQLKLEVQEPAEGAVVGNPAGVFVAGRAVAFVGDQRRFDVIFVLDTSGSTTEMTGADINENGVVGSGVFGGLFGSSDSGDSILAAEVAAARKLLGSLDSRNTRVGLVTFAGDPPDQGGLLSGAPRKPAVTEEALTSDFERLEGALDRVLVRGADGLTHMAAGLDQATVELMGLRGGFSQTDPDSEKIVLFFTDGQPTRPYDPIFEADNVRAVLRAAARARRVGLKVHTFAIGRDALEGPVAAVETARRTGGIFTPVADPADLVTVMEAVSLANLSSLEIRNRTTDTLAENVIRKADGRFSALVPMTAGRNEIVFTARATDGTEAQQVVMVQYAPGAPRPDLPPDLLVDRNQLLERHLVELRRGRLDVERERDEHTRKEILMEIERERAAAQERAARQSKELDLEAEAESSR